MQGSGLGFDEVEVGFGEFLGAFAEPEAGVEGLVVGDVLPGDGEAVGGVVHEGVEGVVGGGGIRFCEACAFFIKPRAGWRVLKRSRDFL